MAQNSTASTPNRSVNVWVILALALLFILVLAVAAGGFLLLSDRADGIALPGIGSGGAPGTILGGQEIDQDVFIVKMDTLTLTPDDMTDKYLYAPGGTIRFDNNQLIKNMGAAYGKPFISTTGRVDGWDVMLTRSDPYAYSPEFIRNRVEIYQESSGASLALSDEWYWAFQIEGQQPDEILDKSCNLGSDCITYMYKIVEPAKGAIVEQYELAYRYQNILVWVMIKGVQGEVNENLLLQYGQMVLDKITLLES
jgi:hypothetical protein